MEWGNNLKNYIKNEFKRGFFSKRNKIAISLCFLCMVLYMHENLFSTYWEVEASYLFTWSTRGFIGTFAPILVCLPFSDSYLDDVNSGMQKYLYTKITPIKYGVIKLFVNGLLGGFVLLIGSFLSFLIFLSRGIHVVKNANILSGLADIYTKSPFGYIFLIMFCMFIFGIVFSTLGLSISTIIKNKYVSMIFPLMFYMILSVFLEGVINWLSPSRLMLLRDGHIFTIFLYDFILFVIGVVIFLIKILRNGDVIE